MIQEQIETQCLQPSFIMNHPIIMSPLAKAHSQGRRSASNLLSERFELFIQNMEIINAYSEQNDQQA